MRQYLYSGLFFATGGLVVAYVIGTSIALSGGSVFDDAFYLITNLRHIRTATPDIFTYIWVLFLALGLGGFAFGAHSATEKLTTAGTSDWQSKRSLRQNELLGTPGAGFVLAKTASPTSKGEYITSDKFPNCLIVAPTGAGKGVGFVYPNLLTFEGSTVTLDIKGENYQTTARWRHHAMGNKIFRFAPAQFGEQSYRYNPLERIGNLSNFPEVMFELRKIANLFLQADGAGEWLNGAIQLFTTIGGVAYERKQFTLGGIYRILSEGNTDLRRMMGELAVSVKNENLRRELSSLAKLESRTLSSYMSVLNNAGFDLWSNAHLDDMTSASDFSFDDLRREKTSIYFVVKDSDIKPLAGLVRLFFNELVSTIQARLPTEEEKYPAMLILDEFHRLGKMTEVADAMTTIRGFNGRIAIITQTIPKLDAIYSREERLSIQGGAGLKLYMTPSEEMTVKDLSEACGMTTKRSITKSKSVGLHQLTTISERTDERPLLTEDEARRLPSDLSIIVVNGKQPVRAKRIVHYEDPTFVDILKKQEGLSWEDITRQGALADLTAKVSAQSKQIAQLEKTLSEAQVLQTKHLEAIEALTNAAIDVHEETEKLPDREKIVPAQKPAQLERVKRKKKGAAKLSVNKEFVKLVQGEDQK